MKGRKWMDSGTPLITLDCLNASMSLYGGVWDRATGRFMNKAWVYSQQYRYLLACLEKQFFSYPRPVSWDKFMQNQQKAACKKYSDMYQQEFNNEH